MWARVIETPPPVARARRLRSAMTVAEQKLWKELRKLDAHIRRQAPIGKYIADFACVEIGLVIELDGGQHVEQAAYDLQREQAMQQLGFRTLRFWDHEVLKETEDVMGKIWQVAHDLKRQALTPALSRKREREQDTLTPTLSRKRERE